MDISALGLLKDNLVRCFNPGILSLAAWLPAGGHTVKVIDLIDTDGLLQTVAEVALGRPPGHRHQLHRRVHYKEARPRQVAAGSEARALIVLGAQPVRPQVLNVIQDVPDLDTVVMYEGE